MKLLVRIYDINATDFRDFILVSDSDIDKIKEILNEYKKNNLGNYNSYAFFALLIKNKVEFTNLSIVDMFF